jgi:hypothetical protein
MKSIILQYFQDSRGNWHQPGNQADFDGSEAQELERRGFIKIIKTAMVEAPESRIVQYSRRARR